MSPRMAAGDLLPNAVRSWADAEPAAEFVRDVGGERWTYGALDRRARSWAAVLARVGVRPGDHVARLTATSCEAVAIWLGASGVGAVDAPVNTEFRGGLLASTLRSSGASVVVCDGRWLEALLEIASEIPQLATVIVTGSPLTSIAPPSSLRVVDATSELEGVQPMGVADLRRPAPADAAMIVFTSGTSGTAKAAVLPWACFGLGARQIAPPGEILTSDDAVYLPYPLFHIAGTFWICAMARIGGRVVLRETFSTTSFWDDVRDHACTVTHLLGATASFIHRSDPHPGDADNPLRVVSMVPLLADLAGFEARFAVRAFSMYGMTELGVVSRTGLSPEDPAACGVPFEHYDVRVVDELDQPVGRGETGELVVRPLEPWSTTTGYLGDSSATVASWRNLWFHTGDAFRQGVDGELYFVDRIKDTIRRRGENISSAVVEGFIGGHPSVLECAAIAVPSEWGEDEVKVCVLPRSGAFLDPAGLVAFLRSAGMPRHMVPRYVEIVDDLPRTPTGKINKSVVREHRDVTGDWDRETEEAGR